MELGVILLLIGTTFWYINCLKLIFNVLIFHVYFLKNETLRHEEGNVIATWITYVSEFLFKIENKIIKIHIVGYI